MNGLLQYHKTINSSTYKQGFTTIGAWALGGWFRNLTSPIMLWYNGSTYALGYEANTTYNAVWLIKQTGNLIQAWKVNDGTDGIEPENHPTPALAIDRVGGYIYFIQNKFHVDEFRVWKSNYPELLNGGVTDATFTQLASFDTDGSYLLTLDDSDINSMWFVTRSGDSSPANGYDQSIINVDLDDPSGYTKLLMTETNHQTTNVRHYQGGAYFEGTSDYRVVFINHRWDTNTNYYKISWYLKKLTDDKAYQFDLAGNKDITVSGVLTPAELEADYVFLGTDSDKSTETYQVLDARQLSNDLFIAYNDNGTTKLGKYTVASSKTAVATITLPYNKTGQETGVVRIVNNGDRLVLLLENDDGIAETWTVEYDLTGLEFKKELYLLDGSYAGMPHNLADVDGKFLMVSRSSGGSGNVPYYLTTETFKD